LADCGNAQGRWSGLLPTTKLLLWEIHRLRALVLRANDLVRSLSARERALDSTTQALLKGLRAALASEPVVQEDEARRLTR